MIAMVLPLLRGGQVRFIGEGRGARLTSRRGSDRRVTSARSAHPAAAAARAARARGGRGCAPRSWEGAASTARGGTVAGVRWSSGRSPHCGQTGEPPVSYTHLDVYKRQLLIPSLTVL